ncbi:AraC family transcriptional regulator [Microbacterium sp. LRZ72]|uniref:AraC family transcriptional regulator n=1 Tax=Microbacterium sp. LRZ72 TaxID=2942481 RepID=UPI0029A878AC|nr:AraC family transcriptional regulator [Microbacterium sp. LRZ72]MDX2377208.1 AraC family transcriptional regulator [Microbacterium sp. LRZ72]
MSATLTLQGTTRGLPVGRDYDHFCESISDVYVGVRPRRPRDARFSADFALHTVEQFSLGIIDTPGASADRDRASLRDVADDAFFLNHSPGAWGLEQRGATWSSSAGGVLLLDNGAPFTVHADARRRLRLTSLRIPREMLGDRTPDQLDTLNDRLSGSPFGAQIGAQAALLTEAVRDGMPRAAHAMALAIVEMLDAVAASAPLSSLPQSDRAASIRSYAAGRLADPTLDLASVARAFRCSTRTVQAAFAQDGATFSAWLRALRLDRARDALRSPTHATRSIARIAEDHGFADVGTFHRAYHARFGTTPGSDR